MVGSPGNGKTWNTTMICDCKIKLSTGRGGYMVITYSDSTQEEWKTKNLCRFHEVE